MPAPKLYADGATNPQPMSKEMAKSLTGRPRKFKSPEEMAKRITEYFAQTDKPSTMHMYLFVTGGSSNWHDYAERPEFSSVMKQAKDYVVGGIEGELLWRKSNVTGPIFWLKNHAGYRDTLAVENTHELGPETLKLADRMLAARERLVGGTTIDGEVIHEED